MKVSLKAMRVNANLTQKQVATAMNVRRETVQNWESNHTYPDAYKLVDLCDLYHCTLSDIFLPKKLAKSERKEKT